MRWRKLIGAPPVLRVHYEISVIHCCWGYIFGDAIVCFGTLGSCGTQGIRNYIGRAIRSGCPRWGSSGGLGSVMLWPGGGCDCEPVID